MRGGGCDNALKLRVRAVVGDDLPLEPDLTRWFAGTPPPEWVPDDGQGPCQRGRARVEAGPKAVGEPRSSLYRYLAGYGRLTIRSRRLEAR